jgi:hypothetical protein
MINMRKVLTGTLAALTLGGAITATATPAAAWCNAWGCGGGGVDAGAVAAGAIGGLALGAIAAGAAASQPQPVYQTCLTRQAVYDPYGNFAGYRRVRVPC